MRLDTEERRVGESTMSTYDEGMSIILANRIYLYTLLQRVFGDEPDLKMIEVVLSSHTKEALQLFETNQNEFEEAYNLLEQIENEMLKRKKTDILDMMRMEYTALLIGPNKLPAPPWESVYVTRENVLFQESTLKVRQFYLKYNLLPEKYPSEADDHLGMELDFMAKLAKYTYDAFVEKDLAKVKPLLLGQIKFLREHLLVWVGTFSKQIQQSKTIYFYPQMASLTWEILNIDLALLNELESKIS